MCVFGITQLNSNVGKNDDHHHYSTFDLDFICGTHSICRVAYLNFFIRSCLTNAQIRSKFFFFFLCLLFFEGPIYFQWFNCCKHYIYTNWQSCAILVWYLYVCTKYTAYPRTSNAILTWKFQVETDCDMRKAKEILYNLNLFRYRICFGLVSIFSYWNYYVPQFGTLFY